MSDPKTPDDFIPGKRDSDAALDALVTAQRKNVKVIPCKNCKKLQVEIERLRAEHRKDLIAAEEGYLEETERLCKERDEARADRDDAQAALLTAQRESLRVRGDLEQLRRDYPASDLMNKKIIQLESEVERLTNALELIDRYPT